MQVNLDMRIQTADGGSVALMARVAVVPSLHFECVLDGSLRINCFLLSCSLCSLSRAVLRCNHAYITETQHCAILSIWTCVWARARGCVFNRHQLGVNCFQQFCMCDRLVCEHFNSTVPRPNTPQITKAISELISPKQWEFIGHNVTFLNYHALWY